MNRSLPAPLRTGVGGAAPAAAAPTAASQGPPRRRRRRRGGRAAAARAANLGSYFSTDDYPAARSGPEAEGTTRFSLAIVPDGRVSVLHGDRLHGNSRWIATCPDPAQPRPLTRRHATRRQSDLRCRPGSVTWRLPAE